VQTDETPHARVEIDLMHEPGANPWIVALLFLARCLVPLGVLLGISYLLRRLGYLTPPAPPEVEPDHKNG